MAATNGYDRIAAAAESVLDQIAAANEAERLGALMYSGREKIDYTKARAEQAVRSAGAADFETPGLSSFSNEQQKRVELAAAGRARELGFGEVHPVPPKANPEAESIVVKRKRMSTITLDDLPSDEREGFPAAGFWSVPVAALYWCDGERSLAEVVRLTELELGPQSFDFVGYFKFLQKHRYVDFVRS